MRHDGTRFVLTVAALVLVASFAGAQAPPSWFGQQGSGGTSVGAGDGEWVRIDAENGPYTASVAGGAWEFRDDSGADYEVLKVCTNDGVECMSLASRYLDVDSSFSLRRGAVSRLSYGSTVTYIDGAPLSFRPSGDIDITTHSGQDLRIDPSSGGEIELAAPINFLDESATTLADVDTTTGGARFDSVGTCNLNAGAVAACAHGISDTVVLEDSSHIMPESDGTSNLGDAASRFNIMATELSLADIVDLSGNGSRIGAAPTALPTCNSASEGMLIYISDTNDAKLGSLCLCGQVSGTVDTQIAWNSIIGGSCPP